MSPLVSVIVAVHNQEKYLGRCLRSLLAQDMDRSDYEIVVVDDASTDRSPYALELFADEVQLVRFEENRGLPSALNAGLRQATAPLVVRVDADDYVNSRFLSTLQQFMELNPEFDAVSCDYLLVTNDEVVLGRGNVDEAPIACGIMFRLDQLIELDLYDENFLSNEDLDLRHRFLAKYAIHRVPLPLYRYRRHEENMTNDKQRLEHFDRMLQRKIDSGGDDL